MNYVELFEPGGCDPKFTGDWFPGAVYDPFAPLRQVCAIRTWVRFHARESFGSFL